MSLEIRTITFNHNFEDKTISALNIRRDRDHEIFGTDSIPEYNSRIPRPSEQSCAAYAISETSGQNVIIRVGFSISSPANVTYEVKATGGGIMGELGSIQVVFSGTDSASVDIPLSNRRFERICRRDITWEWQYRELGGQWNSLAATSHRIYLVLAVPPSPWTQVQYDQKNPWTDLLDEACVIAAGSQSAEIATCRITRAIYTNYSLRYDIDGGSPRYCISFPGWPDDPGWSVTFELMNWIDYVLRGNAPSDPLFCQGSPEEHRDFWIVACYDCAASLSLMSKVLGAQVDFYFHGPFGYLNYVQPIGRGKCNNPFYLDNCQYTSDPEIDPDYIYPLRRPFGNHAYTKLAQTRVYDATMKQWRSATKGLTWRLEEILAWLRAPWFARARGCTKYVIYYEGWFINLSQTSYEQKAIDTSTPDEAQYAEDGSPELHTVDIEGT